MFRREFFGKCLQFGLAVPALQLCQKSADGLSAITTGPTGPTGLQGATGTPDRYVTAKTHYGQLYDARGNEIKHGVWADLVSGAVRQFQRDARGWITVMTKDGLEVKCETVLYPAPLLFVPFSNPAFANRYRL
jgi:hypothetical protein